MLFANENTAACDRKESPFTVDGHWKPEDYELTEMQRKLQQAS